MHPVLLEPVGPTLVAALARSDLGLPDYGSALMLAVALAYSQQAVKLGTRQPLVAGPLASYGYLHQPGRNMHHPTAILVLVAVLAALARAAEPFDAELTVGARLDDLGRAIQDRYGACASVDPPTSLCRRHTLYAVSASLFIERRQIRAVDLDRAIAEHPVLSALAITEPAV